MPSCDDGAVSLHAGNAVLQKRPTWIRIVAQVLALVAASSVPACIYASDADDTALGVWLLAGGSLAMLVLAQVSRLATRTVRGRLHVDDDGVRVGATSLPASDLPAGLACNVVDTRGVELRTPGATTTIDVDGAFVGPLVDALRIHFRARPRFPIFARLTKPEAAGAGIVIGIAAAVLAFVARDSWGYAFFAMPVALIASLILYRQWRKRTLTVGAEGIAIRSAVGTESRLGYPDMDAVVAEGADVRVIRRDGSSFIVGFGLHPEGEHMKRCVVRASMLAAVIDSARGAYDHAARVGDAGRRAAILARGGRDVREWMQALRTLNETQASFRSATLPDEELWRITEDPTEQEPVRVAAAVALRDRLDEGGRRRLRIVADACVVPRLRVALDAASLDDDAALARALEDMEAEDSPKREMIAPWQRTD